MSRTTIAPTEETQALWNELYSCTHEGFLKALPILERTGPDGPVPHIATPIEYLIGRVESVEDAMRAGALIYTLHEMGGSLSVRTTCAAVQQAEYREHHVRVCNESSEAAAALLTKFVLELGAPLEYTDPPEPDLWLAELNSSLPNYEWRHSDDGFSPLHYCAMYDAALPASLLLEGGAAIDVRSAYGLTPLMVGFRSGNSKIVEMLIKRGADLDATTFGGVTLEVIAEIATDDVRDVLSLYRRYRTGPIRQAQDGGAGFKGALVHRTIAGDLVRSKSEVIIANALHYAGVDYEYERVLRSAHQGDMVPDFTIDVPSGVILWEHFGMFDDPRYRAACNAKLERFAALGFVRGHDLFITVENNSSGIDAYEVQQMANKIKDRTVR